MKYHALIVVFEKADFFLIFRLLHIIGGALRVKCFLPLVCHHDREI